jgi:hypothetical protein
MIKYIDSQIIDIGVFIIANLINFFIIGIFISRSKGVNQLEYILGVFSIVMIFPLSIAVILNLLARREWWSFLLPIPIILFLILELILDYLLKIDFRSTTLVWPYIAIYFIGLNGMVGYSFLIEKRYGFVTLITYFINLFMTFYLYFKGKLH